MHCTDNIYVSSNQFDSGKKRVTWHALSDVEEVSGSHEPHVFSSADQSRIMNIRRKDN